MRHLYSGKVRELYELPDGLLLLVATDRISAFDHVLDPPIPDKGRILTRCPSGGSASWPASVPNHLASAPVPGRFEGRAMVCRRLRHDPGGVRCPRLPDRVRADRVRAGPARCAGSACRPGWPTAPGCRSRSSPRPPRPPAASTTRTSPLAQVARELGQDLAAELERIRWRCTGAVAELAAARGIIVADTKVELGRAADGTLLLADEVLTPDSSRFWPADRWQPGRRQPSFDKQYVRDWLTSPASGWDRQRPAPAAAAARRSGRRGPGQTYVEAYRRLTGLTWA